MKLHLKAKVPNEGARRLAQWVLGLPRGLADAETALNTSACRIQRMVEGEMVPGMDVGQKLAWHTGIRFRDFHRPALCGWFQSPDLRQAA